MISRPSVKEAFNASTRLGRRGISQSFKENVMVTSTPIRPKDPPPPPPSQQSRLSRSASSGKVIYDIAESEEMPDSSLGSGINNGLVILHTNNGSLRRNSGAPCKPPRQKKERSQSFTPSSMSEVMRPEPPRAKSYEDSKLDESLVIVNPTVKTPSSSSLTSTGSSSGGGQKSSSSDKDHIYETIPSDKSRLSGTTSRPLPPIPKESVTTSSIVRPPSKLSSSLKTQIDEEDVKSIFVGATKYEILHYLEDAKERGVDGLDITNQDDESDGALADRNHANRVSQFSNDSKCSGSSSNGSSAVIIHNKDNRTTSVEIERNDSGLGSETGKSGKRPIKIRDKLDMLDVKGHVAEQICEDCDQPIEDGIENNKR
jgi:hypothetical protein